jgi:hypothetical protein
VTILNDHELMVVKIEIERKVAPEAAEVTPVAAAAAEA